MLFNSPEFLLLFLPSTVLLFCLFARHVGGRAAHAVLVVASMVFYAYWDYRYLALLLTSTVVNFWIGGQLVRQPNKGVLALGIVTNLSLLGYFKYTDFAIENVNALLGMRIELLHVLLPLGISFFTFQKIAYLVDCYRGSVSDRDPLRFLLFVMFFPQLIAGPIVHHSQIIPQLKAHEKSPIPADGVVAQGLFFLLVGLFKKVVVADYLNQYVNPAFSNVGSLQLVDAWTAALGYTLQLYFDFSAYSEMALGLALLFGLRLPQNFNSPYKATSISDFWRRWHMTLGAFMREYLYIPLGGNRHGLMMMLFASITTMLLGGLWHGAGWTFILWGAMHGVYLVIHKLWRQARISMPAALAQFMTFIAVLFAWVPFRAQSIGDTLHIWQTMLGIGKITLPTSYSAFPGFGSLGVAFAHSPIINGFEILGLVLVAKLCAHLPNVFELWAKMQPKKRWAFAMTGTGMVSLFSISSPSTFLYFQF
jgi:alginate O-acetyltransferase complex protein AlgI